MSTILAPAGQRTVLRRRNHSSLVDHYHFVVQPLAADGPLTGVLEVIASQWIFPGSPQRQPLQARHVVTAGRWATFFELAVIPETDVVVIFTAPPAGASSPQCGLLLVILLVLIVAVVVLVLTTQNNLPP
jgi:hypothetical protein